MLEQYNNQNIKNVFWQSAGTMGIIGIIITEDKFGVYTYTGICKEGNSEDEDIKNIIDWGSKSNNYIAISNKITELTNKKGQ